MENHQRIIAKDKESFINKKVNYEYYSRIKQMKCIKDTL